MKRLDCPDCDGHIVSVCGYHSKARDITGHQPASYATPGEHFLSSHRCGDRVWVACHPCRLLGYGPDVETAMLRIGGYWR